MLNLFLKNQVEQTWDARKCRMKRVLFEFEDGETRELLDRAADDWWHDLHRINCGFKVNWARHKFNIIRK